MATENTVIVLFDGYSEDGDDGIMKANCTSTLIRGKETLTIVDTRTAWDGDELVAGLAKHSVRPNEITHVVCTHGHSDHIGCNYLFLNAKVHIVGQSISNRCEYQSHAFQSSDYQVDDGIRVTMTPGHTMDSVSVLIDHTESGVVAVCGDLFERFEDVADESIWMDAGSEDKHLQRKHRHRMAVLADAIVPGHGPMFRVSDDIRSLLHSKIDNAL